MKYIANIITKNKINVSNFFNVTTNFDEVDKNIPTLIIGWSEVKKLFPNQDILTSDINDSISWTFSKREKRYKYENDLENFINKVISNINEVVNYKFYNFIVSNETKRNSFINYVNHGYCSIYHNSRFLYVYNCIDKITIGISLADISYIGMNTTLFIKSLNKNDNNIICDNLSFIDNESFYLIRDNIKVVAYLYYLKNSDIYKETINNG